jgi:predicted RNA-binding Zn-ribbon protein involved in translation (DUF1610 family)
MRLTFNCVWKTEWKSTSFMEIKVECSKCGQHVLVDDSSLGQTFACPSCGQSITARPITPGARPVSAKELQTNVKQGAAKGGWVCFGVAVIIMFIPIPAWFIYGPLFFVSFILSIVAMSQGRIASGITLLLANVVGVPILFIIAFAFGLATWAIALHPLAAQQSAAATTNQVSDILPTIAAPEPQATNERAASSTAPAVEKIEGAFGKKLGGVFNPASAINTSKLTDGTAMYEFYTANKFRSFEHYYVLITPTTHKIYSIWGIGSVENTEAGQKEQAVVMELLKQKYGTEEKQGLFDTIGDVKRIDYGNRYIMTKITGFTDVTLDIRYYDSELEKLAEQERIASEIQKTDKTGL